MLRGCDLSFANNIVDYDRLAQQIDFAIIRAGYGKYISQEDVRYRTHLNELRKRDIPLGAFWYSYAESPQEAMQEAHTCIEVLKTTKFEYPIYLDIEESKHVNMPPDVLATIIQAFCNVLEDEGFWVGVYSCKAILERLPAKILNRYAIWCAGIDCLPIKQSGMYQYSWHGKGKYFGQMQDPDKNFVDLDICIYDYPAMIKKQHKNNY